MLTIKDYRQSRSYWLAELGRARRWRAFPLRIQEAIINASSPFPGASAPQSSIHECRERLAHLRRMIADGEFTAAAGL